MNLTGPLNLELVPAGGQSWESFLRPFRALDSLAPDDSVTLWWENAEIRTTVGTVREWLDRSQQMVP